MDAVEIEIDVAEEEEEEVVLQQENAGTDVHEASTHLFAAEGFSSVAQEESAGHTEIFLLQEDQDGQDSLGATVTVIDTDADSRKELDALSAMAPSTESDPDMNKQHDLFNSTVPSTQLSREHFEGEWVTPLSVACYYNMNANSDCTAYSLAKVKIEPGVEQDTQTVGEVNACQESGEPHNPDTDSEKFVNPSGPTPALTYPFSTMPQSTQLGGGWYETQGVDSTAFDYSSRTSVFLTTSGSVQMPESEYMSVLHVSNSSNTVDAVPGCSVLPVSVSSGSEVDKHLLVSSSGQREDRGTGVCASGSSNTQSETQLGGIGQNTSTSEDFYACEHPGCGATFTKKKNLKLHVLFGHKPEKTGIVPVIEKPPVVFKCMQPGCSAAFHLASHLNEHRATHTEERPHKCSFCHIAFSKDCRLKRHKCVPRKLFRCDKCDATVFTKNSLEEHKQEVHMKKCVECEEIFEDESTLKYHFSLVHTALCVLASGRFRCPACGDAFSSAKCLKQHSVVHTGTKTLKCSHCPEMFRRKRDLKSHIRTHRTFYKCKDCGLLFSKASTLSKHICDHKKLWQCTKCEARFMRKKTLNNHMTHKHTESVCMSVVPEMPPEPGSVMRPEPRMKLGHAPVPIACYYNLGANLQAKIKVEPGTEPQPKQLQAVDLCQIQLSDMQADPYPNKSCMSATTSVASNGLIQKVSSGILNGLTSASSPEAFNPVDPTLPTTQWSGGQYGVHRINSASSSVTLESLLSSVSSDVSNDVGDHDNHSFHSFSTAQVVKTDTRADLDRSASGKEGKSRSKRKTTGKSSKIKPELVYRCVQSDCSAVFHSVADLDEHRALHQKKSFQCKQCGTLFAKQLELQKHQCEQKVIDPPFKCKKCGARFVHKVTLAKHTEAAHETKGFMCALCQGRYLSAQELQAHIERKHLLMKKDKTNKSVRKLFKCGDCDAVFSHAAYLASHRVVHTGDKPFKCPQCSVYFRKKSEYKTHRSLWHKRVSYECDECGASFCKAYTLAKHKIKHQKPFKCSLCPISYLTAATLESHMFTFHHQAGKSSKFSLFSQEKNSEIKSVKGLDAEPVMSVRPVSLVMEAPDLVHSHLSSKLGNRMSGHKAESGSPPQLKPMGSVYPVSASAPSTKVCGGHSSAKFVKTKKSAAASKRDKTKPGRNDTFYPPGSADDSGIVEEERRSGISNPSSPKPLSTQLRRRWLRTNSIKCGEVDHNPSSHKNSSISEYTAKPFKCSNCYVAFRTQAEFDRHRKTLRCPECGIVYNSLQQLRKHMPAHHLKPYKCAQCGIMYAFGSHMKKHITEQHSFLDQPTLKLFQCADCDAVFTTMSGLESHRQVHAKDSLSKCMRCCAIFRSKRKLKEHMTSHWTVYSCEKCSARFFRRKTLIGHMNRHRDRPFTCTQCEASFVTDIALRVHMNKSHSTGTDDKVLFPSTAKLTPENCVAPEMPPEPGSMEPLLEPLLKPESATPVPIACYFNLGSSAKDTVLSVNNVTRNVGDSGVFPVRLERVGPAIPEDGPQMELSSDVSSMQIEEMDVS